jgi:hypothetical protein
MPELVRQQAEFTRHIRNPAEVGIPAGVESRRMKIYDDLIYNNIESFLVGGFPVLRSLYRDEDWHGLVRAFVRDHRCATPYFLEISQEFVGWLMQDFQPRPVDPPFAIELAHYEWVELALDVSAEEVTRSVAGDDFEPLQEILQLSPLAWLLSYRYPVHKIGPGVEPDEPPADVTYLLVYRNREDTVKFIEINAATARLLELVRDNEQHLSGRALLEQLAVEMNADSITPVVDFGATSLREFFQLGVVLVHSTA